MPVTVILPGGSPDARRAFGQCVAAVKVDTSIVPVRYDSEMQMARHDEFSVSAIIRYWGAVRDLSGRVVADELSAVVGTNRLVAPGTAIVTGSGSLAATKNVRRVIHVAFVHGEQVRVSGRCTTSTSA